MILELPITNKNNLSTLQKSVYLYDCIIVNLDHHENLIEDFENSCFYSNNKQNLHMFKY